MSVILGRVLTAVCCVVLHLLVKVIAIYIKCTVKIV
jgi:hypothetical protein